MKTICSIRDVARQAEVAPSTVSRVLNNRMGNLRIAEDTRKKIINAARDLNYAPNVNAKRLFSNRTGIIGLLVPSFRKMGVHIFEDNHLIRIISGLEKGFGCCKYSLLLLFNDDEFIREKRYLGLFRERNIDGLLIWGAYENETFWEELAREKYPYMFLSNIPDTAIPVNYMTNDHETAGYLMTRHILEKGHRKIVWLGGKTNISINRDQEKGINKALGEYGIRWSDITVRYGNYQGVDGERIVGELLAEKTDMDCIICANHGMAYGALNLLARQGIAVPGQIAIGCCDTYQNLDEHMAHITRIETSDLGLGEAAAMAIVSIIDNPDQSVHVRYPANFIAGKTV